MMRDTALPPWVHDILGVVLQGAYAALCERNNGDVPSYLEMVSALQKPDGGLFLLVHEPDGPWLMVRPVGDTARATMDHDDPQWAEKQRWEYRWLVSAMLCDNDHVHVLSVKGAE